MADPRIQIIATLMRSVFPAIMAVGIVGNLLNIIVLRRARLYNHPCSRYFLALAINNLFISIFPLTFNILANGYQIDPTNNSQVWCKVILYIQQVSVVISPYLIVLASIDRYCASSSNARRRNLSNLAITKWSILSVYCFFILFYINSLVLLNINPGQAVSCRISATELYGQVYSIIQAILLTMAPPVLMTVFGLLTIMNTKMAHVAPVGISRFRRTEAQLIQMLLSQVGSHVLLSSPLCVVYILGILPVQYLSPIQYFFAFRLCQIIFALSYAASVGLYFLSSKVYRRELVHIIKVLFRRRRLNQVSVFNAESSLRLGPMKTWTVAPASLTNAPVINHA